MASSAIEGREPGSMEDRGNKRGEKDEDEGHCKQGTGVKLENESSAEFLRHPPLAARISVGTLAVVSGARFVYFATSG